MSKDVTLRIRAGDMIFFGAVLTCAVRYCLGRMTYMPGLVTDWIMNYCEGKMSPTTITVMKRDIDEAKESPFGLGMECDVKMWGWFREWLDRQG